MSKFLGLIPLGLAVFAACTLAKDKVRDGAPADSVSGKASQTICADGTDALCSSLPTDMAGAPPGIGYIPNTNAGGATGAFNQTYVDYFGWQSFVALNWPVDSSGKPSTTQTLVTDTTSPRVWSTYPTKADVFGVAAVGVDTSSCGSDPRRLKLFQTSKFGLSGFTESFTPYPLIDRYGNYVLYDVRLNPTEVTYLQKNGLTTKAGQQAFGKPYAFPGGSGAAVGAIEIKTAWRIMTDQDPADSFYTTAATIIIPAKYSQTGQPLCIDATVGLVGLHIMQKFSNPSDFSEYWAWASFEHVNNAPVADKAPVSQTNGASTLSTLAPPSCSLVANPHDVTKYSFYNVACTAGSVPCEINQPPALPKDNIYLWAPSQPYASAYLTKGGSGQFGTQAARCFDIYASAKKVTGAYQSKFGKSVWSNYMLIGVQWAAASSTGSGPLTELHPYPAPIYLANTTMETYLQTGPVMQPKSGAGSCITCHNLAVDTAGNVSNMSFLPGDAH